MSEPTVDYEVPTPPPKPMKINVQGLAEDAKITAWQVPTAPPGVIPAPLKLACDEAINANYNYAIGSAFAEGLGFLGYPYLAELTQRPEYRRPSEIIAKEMTRKWMELISTGDSKLDDKTDKIKAIDAELKRLKVREMFCKVTEHDGFFGRGQLYMDTGSTDNPEELTKPLSATVGKIGKGALKRLVLVDPTWTYPNGYNSTDPLKDDYFVPKEWFVMGKRIHASRLMFFISRKVPDMLKPAYAFGGLSLSQMAKPYIDNWLRARQSVSDLIHSFSVLGLKTNLSAILIGGATDEMYKRAELFNQARDNRGMLIIDKDTEELFNVSTPLSTLDMLQAQAQEQMAAVTGIPLVKLLGITPSGLNASSDGEIRVFYDWIQAQQEADFNPHLDRLLNIVQLSLFGEIDPEISFQWVPLWTMNETELSACRKTEADTAIAYINAGVISPEEERVRLASEKQSAYAALDLDEDVPELPDDDGEEEPDNLNEENDETV